LKILTFEESFAGLFNAFLYPSFTLAFLPGQDLSSGGYVLVHITLTHALGTYRLYRISDSLFGLLFFFLICFGLVYDEVGSRSFYSGGSLGGGWWSDADGLKGVADMCVDL